MTNGGDGRLDAYLELVRLPNVFTAMADVLMGCLFVKADLGPDGRWLLGLLMAASSALYMSGMVLNDVFDLGLDTHQRPERPLPSGRVPLAAARRLGWMLLLLGIGLACGAALLRQDFRPAVVGTLLAGCIVAYDARLKRTPVGPLGMGACRMLNVLLGMSVAPAALQAEHWVVAGGVGVYVAGLTWLARNEAAASRRRDLALATLVMMLGIALIAWLPRWTDDVVLLIQTEPYRWYLLMGLLGLLIGWRCLWAVIDPRPSRVRMAVAHGILSLVMLDAVACFAVRDWQAATAILLLLLPAMFLQRWMAMT
jgi:4-hydroxybenzoate polyprenyltransferase